MVPILVEDVGHPTRWHEVVAGADTEPKESERIDQQLAVRDHRIALDSLVRRHEVLMSTARLEDQVLFLHEDTPNVLG